MIVEASPGRSMPVLLFNANCYGKDSQSRAFFNKIGETADYIKGIDNRTVDIPIEVDGLVRYTVPQKITVEKDVTVYFRVSNVYRNVKINVYNQKGEVVLSKKKPRVAPSEMETVTIKADALKGAEKLRFEMEVAQ